MPSYKRVSVLVSFPENASRLRLGVAIAASWGIEIGQDIECLGFFREAGELLCIPAKLAGANGRSPLSEVLGLEAAHDGDDVDVPAIAQVPSAKHLIGPDRLVRFQVKWGKDAHQFDLQFKKETAAKLGRTDTQLDVWALTWKGWLILMSPARYERYLNEPW